jgi:hypothetical protein
MPAHATKAAAIFVVMLLVTFFSSVRPWCSNRALWGVGCLPASALLTGLEWCDDGAWSASEA